MGIYKSFLRYLFKRRSRQYHHKGRWFNLVERAAGSGEAPGSNPGRSIMKKRDWDIKAGEYFDIVLSPFAKGVDNPLPAALKKVKGNTVIDLGTGIGNALPLLKENFKSVTAIDYSQTMIDAAEKKHKDISFAVADMRNLKKYHNKFDVAISINSVLSPSHKDVKIIIKEIYRVIKKNGSFLAVFPSMEGQLYGALLTFERELKKTNNREQAWDNTNEIMQRHNFDFVKGTFAAEGVKQKFFYEFELEYRLRKAGFKDIIITKVNYPWRLWDDYNWKSFQKEPPFWDWFVVCKK